MDQILLQTRQEFEDVIAKSRNLTEILQMIQCGYDEFFKTLYEEINQNKEKCLKSRRIEQNSNNIENYTKNYENLKNKKDHLKKINNNLKIDNELIDSSLINMDEKIIKLRKAKNTLPKLSHLLGLAIKKETDVDYLTGKIENLEKEISNLSAKKNKDFVPKKEWIMGVEALTETCKRRDTLIAQNEVFKFSERKLTDFIRIAGDYIEKGCPSNVNITKELTNSIKLQNYIEIPDVDVQSERTREKIEKYIKEFCRYLSNEEFSRAALVAVYCPLGTLRNVSVLEKFTKAKNSNAVISYCEALSRGNYGQVKWNRDLSENIVGRLLESKEYKLLTEILTNKRITITVEICLKLDKANYDLNIIEYCYEKIKIPEYLVGFFIKSKQYSKAISLIRDTQFYDHSLFEGVLSLEYSTVADFLNYLVENSCSFILPQDFFDQFKKLQSNQLIEENTK